MAHKHHGHNLRQETIVWRTFWTLVVIYFLLQLILIMNQHDLFGAQLLRAGGPTLFWESVKEAWLGRLKPIFLVLQAAFVVVFLFSLYKVWPIKPKLSVRKNPHAHGHGAPAGTHGAAASAAGAPSHDPAVLKHWTDIVRRANTGTPENLRWAIMESDALVDLVLKDKGLPGETMADRLANFRRDDTKSIDRLWDAHKLRNEIAHTPGFKVTTRQAEKALLGYRDFLKELKAF